MKGKARKRRIRWQCYRLTELLIMDDQKAFWEEWNGILEGAIIDVARCSRRGKIPGRKHLLSEAIEKLKIVEHQIVSLTQDPNTIKKALTKLAEARSKTEDVLNWEGLVGVARAVDHRLLHLIWNYNNKYCTPKD